MSSISSLRQELRSCLGKTAPKRQETMVRHLKKNLPPVLTELLDTVIKMYREQDPSWRQGMTLFKKSIKVKVHCGPAFTEVVQKAEASTLYETWFSTLIFESIPLYRDNTQTALKIKELLYTTKEHFFQDYFSEASHTYSALNGCIELYDKKLSPQEMLQAFADKKRAYKTRIGELETSLLSRIGRISGIASSVIRLFTRSYYVQSAEYIVEARERALESLPMLQTPKEGPYLASSKIMTAVGLVFRDLALWGTIGLPRNILHSISHDMLPGACRMVSVLDRLQVDEQTTLQHFSKIRRIFECAAFVGINCIMSGVRTQTIVESVTGYIAASLISEGCGKFVDFFYKDPKNSPTHAFVRLSAQMIAFPLIHSNLFSYILSEPESMSPEEASELLNVSAGASQEEIKRAFRELAPKYHPDKNSTGQEMFIKLRSARDRLIKMV